MRTMRTKFLVRYINMIYCLAETPVCEIPTHRLGQRPLLRHADCLGGNLGKLLTHTSSSSYRAQKLSILEAGVGGSPAKRKSSLFSFVKKIVPALRHTKRQHGPRQGFVWGHVCNFARILLVLDFCSHPPLVGYLPRSCMGQNTSIWRISMMTLPTTLPIPISFVEMISHCFFRNRSNHDFLNERSKKFLATPKSMIIHSLALCASRVSGSSLRSWSAS